MAVYCGGFGWLGAGWLGYCSKLDGWMLGVEGCSNLSKLELGLVWWWRWWRVGFLLG